MNRIFKPFCSKPIKIKLISTIVSKFIQKQSISPKIFKLVLGYSAARPGAATNSTAAGGAKAARIWYKEDLSSVGFFYRSTLHDHIKFNARLLCERTPDGGRQSVAFENDMGRCFSQRLPGGLACAVVTSNKMEARLAFAIITTIMDQYDFLHT